MSKSKKEREKTRKKYSDAQLDLALSAVKSGRSIASVSKDFKIPRSTISYKISGKSPIDKNMGPSTVLTKDEEDQLVRWMFHASSHGHPVTKNQLLNSVAKLVKNFKNRSTPFINNRPGRSWYKSFLQRHPTISKRVSQNLTYSRSSLSEHAVRKWYADNGAYLEKKKLLNIGPERIFNGDESAFQLNPKADYVLVEKGNRNVYTHIGNNEKEALTVLFVANATGTLAPPMVVFNYERIPAYVTANIPNNWGIGKSENGWMTSETFYEYVTNIFEPWLTKENIPRPVILYIDGHSSHLTMELSNFCRDHQIELIALYPNATHVMQPLDVAFFKPLKTKYKECVTEWRIKNDGDSMKRENCASVLKEALDKVDCPKIISNGFRKCGLYPFSAESIDYSKLQKSINILSSTETSIPSTSSGDPVKHKEEDYLTIFERDIDEKLLADFYTCESSEIWNGEIQHQSLFNVWLNIRKRYRIPISHISTDMDEKASRDILNCASDIEETIYVEESMGEDVNNIVIEVLDNIESLNLGEDLSSRDVKDGLLIFPLNETNHGHSTPEKSGQVSTIQDNRIIPKGISSPFKNACFWPKPKIIKKKRTKEQVPSAATSDEWRAFHLRKQEELERQKQEKAERKRKREENAAEKVRLKEEAKRIRFEKKEARQAEIIAKKKIKQEKSDSEGKKSKGGKHSKKIKEEPK